MNMCICILNHADFGFCMITQLDSCNAVTVTSEELSIVPIYVNSLRKLAASYCSLQKPKLRLFWHITIAFGFLFFSHVLGCRSWSIHMQYLLYLLSQPWQLLSCWWVKTCSEYRSLIWRISSRGLFVHNYFQ